MLYGAKAVLGFLSERYGYKITRYTLWRLSRRKRDPLPLHRRRETGGDERPRICASQDRLDKWAARNLGWSGPK